MATLTRRAALAGTALSASCGTLTSALIALATAGCATLPRADSDGAIEAWAIAHYGEGLRGAPQIFHGDFTGDGAPDALAWTTYNDGGLHNFGEAALFRGVRGQMVFVRIDDIASGENPRDLSFTRGRVTFTTTIFQDGDARCCPTGAHVWVIDTR